MFQLGRSQRNDGEEGKNLRVKRDFKNTLGNVPKQPQTLPGDPLHILESSKCINQTVPTGELGHGSSRMESKQAAMECQKVSSSAGKPPLCRADPATSQEACQETSRKTLGGDGDAFPLHLARVFWCTEKRFPCGCSRIFRFTSQSSLATGRRCVGVLGHSVVMSSGKSVCSGVRSTLVQAGIAPSQLEKPGAAEMENGGADVLKEGPVICIMLNSTGVRPWRRKGLSSELE